MSETPFGQRDNRDMGESHPGGRIGGAPVPAAGAGGQVLGSITLARRPEEVAAARRFVAKALGDRPQTATALLLTSEAVTNAVVHAGGPAVTVTVTAIAGGVRVEVADGGADTVPTLRSADPGRADGELSEGGRGVLLIRRLATRSGFRADQSGLTYWFEL
jgi:anti-sigma regulatory factor (Ser/Thr protein kinase)